MGHNGSTGKHTTPESGDQSLDTSSVLCYLCVSTGAYNIQAPKPQFLHLENGINDLFFFPSSSKKKKGFLTDKSIPTTQHSPGTQEILHDRCFLNQQSVPCQQDENWMLEWSVALQNTTPTTNPVPQYFI